MILIFLQIIMILFSHRFHNCHGFRPYWSRYTISYIYIIMLLVKTYKYLCLLNNFFSKWKFPYKIWCHTVINVLSKVAAKGFTIYLLKKRDCLSKTQSSDKMHANAGCGNAAFSLKYFYNCAPSQKYRHELGHLLNFFVKWDSQITWLNLLMVVCFLAWASFFYWPNSIKNFCLIQK